MGLCVYLLLVHFGGVVQVNTNVFVVSSLFWCFMCPRFCGFYKKTETSTVRLKSFSRTVFCKVTPSDVC